MTTQATRIEHELLGEKAVPKDAYYGVQTARALENFHISEYQFCSPAIMKSLAIKLSKVCNEPGRAAAVVRGILNPLPSQRRSKELNMRRLAIAAALSLMGAAAFAQDVKTDFDKSANFGAIKTFTLKIGTSWNNQISEKRVSDEIAQTLTEKGWKQVDANPDALVLLHGATEKEKSLNTFYSGGGYGGYGYRGWGGMGGTGTATTTTSEYLVGTLVVDIFDTKSKALMFRGTASDEISDKPEKNVKKLDKASNKMFKDFPPGSKEKK